MEDKLEDKLKLCRAVAVARKSITLARVLLHASTLSEAKREEVSRWLVASEKDLVVLEDELGSAASLAAAETTDPSKAVKTGNPLLSPGDKAVLRSFPQRSYALVLEGVEKLARGTLVELVCRLHDGMSLVRVAQAPQTVVTMPHAKLVVVQESATGIPWALAECEAQTPYKGAGPELSFEEGAALVVTRVNANGWWLGLLGGGAAAGLFPATAVRMTKIYSPQLTNFVKKLARAMENEDNAHPSAKLKLAMVAAIRNRGAEEVAAFHMQAFNERRLEDMPAVLISSCVLEFSLTEELQSASHCVTFKCPDMGGTTEAMDVEIVAPRLGPNLLDRVAVQFDPATFVLSENEEEEVEVTITATAGLALDASVSVMVPVQFTSRRGNCKCMRYFILCELTTPVLRHKNRLSHLVADDRDSNSSSELWGETMTSGDLAAAGMSDLLSDLMVMPESKKPVPPAKGVRPQKQPPQPPSSPPTPIGLQPKAARSRPDSGLLRASDSNVPGKQLTRVSATARQRTASGGNHEDMPAEAGGSSTFSGSGSGNGSASGTPTSGGSPRGVLANVRARLTRNRSQSSGNEEDATASGSGFAVRPVVKERKSPRSPRLDETTAVATVSPSVRRGKSKTELVTEKDKVSPTAATGGGASPPAARQGAAATGGGGGGGGAGGDKTVLDQRRNKDAPIVRRRETSEVERKPGWVASIDRRNSPGFSSPLVESAFSSAGSGGGESVSSLSSSVGGISTGGSLVPLPVSPKPGGGPPRKALPVPDNDKHADAGKAPLNVEFDSAEFKN